VILELTPEAPLAELAAATQRGAVAAGFPPEERRFRAHATLGRLRDGRYPDAAGLPPPPPSPGAVREVVLFQSQLGPGGSRYQPLERMPLGGQVSPHNQATRGDVT
jgi:2'-5' RNA ligase